MRIVQRIAKFDLDPIGCTDLSNQAQPTIHPNSAKSVMCALIIVRISGMPSKRNAEATAPEFPSSTPSGFAAKSRSPASQIFGRFRIETHGPGTASSRIKSVAWLRFSGAVTVAVIVQLPRRP